MWPSPCQLTRGGKHSPEAPRPIIRDSAWVFRPIIAAVSHPKSPRITHVSWGHMDVEDLGSGKDFILYPGGGRPWDWSETGMRHDPGIRPVDVEELLRNGATTVVLSRGMEERLQIDPSTLEHLAAKGIDVHVAETREAVELYNKFSPEVPV